MGHLFYGGVRGLRHGDSASCHQLRSSPYSTFRTTERHLIQRRWYQEEAALHTIKPIFQLAWYGAVEYGSY